MAVHRDTWRASVSQVSDAYRPDHEIWPLSCGNRVKPGHGSGHNNSKILDHACDLRKRAALGNRTPDLRITRVVITANTVLAWSIGARRMLTVHSYDIGRTPFQATNQATPKINNADGRSAGHAVAIAMRSWALGVRTRRPTHSRCVVLMFEAPRRPPPGRPRPHTGGRVLAVTAPPGRLSA